MSKDNPTPKSVRIAGEATQKSLHLTEGMTKKGGVNAKPMTPRPEPPKGQGRTPASNLAHGENRNQVNAKKDG